jgi:hypothetical protein
MCLAEGKVEPATLADHVIPHRGDQKLFFFGELQSLFSTHHSSDKALLERGIVKRFDTAIGETGWPRDERHPVYGRQK